ncbi:MAG: sporulation protein YunB [Oscillospiraceae bacterium]|nr:sporulation protein YunB [Oscillospiraceae bacterium]
MRRKRRRGGGWFRFWAAALCAAIALVALDTQVRPVIRAYAGYQAKVYATRAIDAAVLEVLSREQVTYDGLIHVSRGNGGEILALQTDAVAVNRLKSLMTAAITRKLEEMESQEVRVHAGTLSGAQFLAGRGPMLSFRLLPAGFARASLCQAFDSAGVNQTHHQVKLEVEASITAVIPAYSVTTQVATDVVLAETVIVGSVPQAYLNGAGFFGAS